MARDVVDTVAVPRQRGRGVRARPGAPARRRWPDAVILGYVGVVLLGAVLIAIAALRQPFSYDELTQIDPYGSHDLGTILGATRQPPLAPLAEAVVQWLLGQGQWQQRLLPALAGVGCLVAMALLLRRLGLRGTGVLALLAMATSPLLVRYAAYTRPYTEPLALMLLLALAMHAWLGTGRRAWLATAGGAAVLLPLVRVPESMAFLAVAILVLLVGRQPRRRPLLVVLAGAFALVGVPMYVLLSHRAGSIADTSPGGMLDRVGPGLHELVHGFLPVLASSFPWWPLTLAVAVLAAVLAGRRLAGWTAFWPLLAAPVAFAVAYHLAFRISFDALPYRARFTVFFVPAFVLAAAALLATRRVRWLAAALVAAVVVLQLPATARVLTRDAAPDFAQMATVLKARVPAGAVVLYDRTTPPGASRQPYLGQARYLGATPAVVNVTDAPRTRLPGGPVWLLFNGQCAYAGRCVPGRRHQVDAPIAGYRLVYRHDRFTLYAPTGRSTPVDALLASAQALGPRLGYVQAWAAADLLRLAGRGAAADRVLARLRLSPADTRLAHVTLHHYGLD